jgi:hypothetical protein
MLKVLLVGRPPHADKVAYDACAMNANRCVRANGFDELFQFVPVVPLLAIKGDADVERFRGRVSGPLLDRIELHVNVVRVSYGELASDRCTD